MLRSSQLLHLPEQLLPQAATVRALCATGPVRLLLPETDAVHFASVLLRPKRLLPEAVLPLSAFLLAGVVHVRRAQLCAGEQVVLQAAATFPSGVVGRLFLEGVTGN